MVCTYDGGVLFYPAVTYACESDFKYHVFALYRKVAFVLQDAVDVLIKPKAICYYSMSLKLMVPLLQCKLKNDRKVRMKEKKGKQPEAGGMERGNAQ